MIKGSYWLGCAAIAAAALVTPRAALAQFQYGGQGLGSAMSSNAMSHQGQVRPGVDDIASQAAQETPFKIIKDVKLGLKDADPNVRVSELIKLRNLRDPEVDPILMQSMADPDIRVKMKAIDILGARECNASVTQMSQMLFLRSTEPIVKLHLVAALGRIGDSQGTVPIMQYMAEDQDEKARGTAVFALGEIGSDQCAPLLRRVSDEDQSQMVRRLANEALKKVDGELPTERAREVAQTDKSKDALEPTDQRLAKMREEAQKMSDAER
ncbi:MAG TPA: HEAT repeat domain-containing protein [Candidatus Binataceae bacterium]|nr:HEAT repeat domain-containing protein [Candidatus Binataceae bacterium]